MSGSAVASASDVDQVLKQENDAFEIKLQAMPLVDDMTYLRRTTVDLIGRIPSGSDIHEYMKWPADQRRAKLVDKLLGDERFADRWTTFFGDLLRLRSNATGGAALTAYVHQAIAKNMPYDELCRRLIAANGKANTIPEVGFILGDNADPMAMAAVTAQVFMGIRISCAQCHDHPFDKWTRNDFYSLAAFFGKTRRVESQRTRVVYTTEADQTTVLWPPEDEAKGERKPMKARFPFTNEREDKALEFIARLVKLRAEQERARAAAKNKKNPLIDELLATTADKANRQTRGITDFQGVASEAKQAIRNIDIQASLYRQSELRTRLADLITSPRNRLFARSFVNRLWKELVGHGFVEPVDDFSNTNLPSHPKTLNYLSEEFVASGYDFRNLVKMIVTTDVYARSHVPDEADDVARKDLESNFLATPMRRMIGEALYDSIVTAGHLFDVKHPAGANEKIVYDTIRVAVTEDGKPIPLPKRSIVEQNPGASMPAMMARAGGGYALEDAIELNFAKLLMKKDEGVVLDRMRIMSREELEAQRMLIEEMARKNNPNVKYITKTVKRVYDDNPKFNSTFRMAAPAPAGHFVRVFGQTARGDLSEKREDTPTMRQALMMLNGRLTHEASRVGQLEPIHPLLVGPKANVEDAIKVAYHEVLTRNPTAEEIADGKQIVALADSPLDGMADLRWVLLNCNEFRFIP